MKAAIKFLAAAGLVLASSCYLTQDSTDPMFAEVGRYQVVELSDPYEGLLFDNGTGGHYSRPKDKVYLFDTKTGSLFRRNYNFGPEHTAIWSKDTENVESTEVQSLKSEQLDKLEQDLKDPSQGPEARKKVRMRLWRLRDNYLVSTGLRQRIDTILQHEEE